MKTRRDFIKAGLAIGASLPLANLGKLFAADSPATTTSNLPVTPATAKPILVAVRDGERAAMLDKAMAALGGMEAFVKKGQTVLVKPNIGWDSPPERGADTHPETVKRVIEMCFAAGAKSVSMFDNPCDQWQRTYANSGIEKVAKDTGARLVNGKDQTLYRQAEIPNGKKLHEAKIHSLVLDSDVFINVPVLKHHAGSLITGCMKNLMGIVWDRGFYHRTDLHQCIADLLTLKKPSLNILDAYAPMVRNGPRGKSADDLVVMRTLLVSTDIVAIDAAGAKLLNHQPSEVRHIAIAADMKLGTMDLEQVDIRRFKLA
ncbi:MAG: DUF362 domain-containing protein [Verrucomicrobiota bacterium]|jgi:uncharacterized protein (DUF362 family)